MKGLVLALSILFVLASSTISAHADDNAVVGTINSIEPSMIEVVTDSGCTVQIAVCPDTKYEKWVIEKPWVPQDAMVDLSWLRVGERVRIKVREDNPEVARKVWVVVGVGVDS